jgi:broad specificity phosphatase PhoE
VPFLSFQPLQKYAFLRTLEVWNRGWEDKQSQRECLIIFSDPFLQTRSFSAVLFRRIATKTSKDLHTNETKELFSILSPDQRVAIREKLVSCLSSESLADVRNKVGDAIAEIARQYTDNGELTKN